MSHRTTYSYDDDVTDSLGIGHLMPRELPGQQVASYDVLIDPTPNDVSHAVDYFGNVATYFQVTRPHRVLDIESVSEVTVTGPTYSSAGLAQPWERARPLRDPGLPGAWQATDVALASPLAEHTTAAAEYAARSLTRGRPIGEAVTELMHRIHADFSYDKTATTVTSTTDEIFAKRAGVCQDFAHLTLACLRSHGVAARYVSGYLATEPPPGRERIVGADASHAWVAVWLPAVAEGEVGEWLAVDPTNDQWVGDRYVTVAWGRDYGDVAPVKGVIFTDATRSTLDVAVDVAPLAA